MYEFFQEHPTLYIVVRVVLILIGTAVVAGLLRFLANRLGTRLAKKEKTFTSGVSRKMLGKSLPAIIYILGIITAVNQIPTLTGTLRALLAGSGVLAVIIGFAAQESFGNLISGVLLSIFKPFDVGDRITLVDRNVTGFVEDITLRHTVIRTVADTRTLIPNAIMGSAIVENVDYADGVLPQVPIQVDVAYDTNLELAVRVLRETLAPHPLRAGETEPRVLVTGFGASGVTLVGYLPVKDAAAFASAASDARIMVKQAFDASGITIPYQTITISERSVGKQPPEDREQES